MPGNGRLRDRMEGLRDLCTAEIWSMEASLVDKSPRRFEAGYFASQGFMAVEAMKCSGFEIASVKDIASVIWHGIQTRVFVDDPARGLPYLNTSAMMEAKPNPVAHLSRKATKHVDLFEVQEHEILVSMSGSIGNVRLVDRDLHGWAVTVDALRVKAIQDSDLGILYVFLQSPLGQFLLKKSETGSVVRHIYDSDVSGLPVPRLPRALCEELTRLIKQASVLRVHANRLLDNAEELIYKQNYIEMVGQEPGDHLEYGSIKVSELRAPYRDKPGNRLEATYHARRARLAETQVRQCRSFGKLIELVQAIPFTGPGSQPGVNKVEPEFGRPTITAQNLRRARPRPAYHVASRKQALVNNMIPPPRSTLMMCAGSGNTGICDYVSRSIGNWAVSLDVIRIIPDERRLHPGYVYAFLNSPLGQAQVLRQIYGSAIPRIHSRQVEQVLVPIPEDRGRHIGSMVEEAFELRAKAFDLEEDGIKTLLTALKQGRKTIESEWGDEY